MTPAHEYLRYSTMRDWLGEVGIPEAEVRKLIECGKIKGTTFRTAGRNFYLTSQIQRDVLNNNSTTKPE